MGAMGFGFCADMLRVSDSNKIFVSPNYRFTVSVEVFLLVGLIVCYLPTFCASLIATLERAASKLTSIAIA